MARDAVLEPYRVLKSGFGNRVAPFARPRYYAVSQPEHVNINKVLVRPTGQRR